MMASAPESAAFDMIYDFAACSFELSIQSYESLFLLVGSFVSIYAHKDGPYIHSSVPWSLSSTLLHCRGYSFREWQVEFHRRPRSPNIERSRARSAGIVQDSGVSIPWDPICTTSPWKFTFCCSSGILRQWHNQCYSICKLVYQNFIWRIDTNVRSHRMWRLCCCAALDRGVSLLIDNTQGLSGQSANQSCKFGWIGGSQLSPLTCSDRPVRPSTKRGLLDAQHLDQTPDWRQAKGCSFLDLRWWLPNWER